MQLRDLTDAFFWIRKLIYRVDRLEGGAMLENSSITSGRMRFIGGLLRVDSGGRVEIVGTLQVDGESTITGQFNVVGPFSLTGDGEITGQLTISGPVSITGDIDLTGIMTVTGDIVVTGTGKIRIGDMVLDPSVAGGALVYGNGSRLEADGTNNGIRLIAGDSIVNVGAVASIRKGPSSVIVSPDSVTVNAAGGGDISLIGRVRSDRAAMPTIVDPNAEEGTLRILPTGVWARTVLA